MLLWCFIPTRVPVIFTMWHHSRISLLKMQQEFTFVGSMDQESSQQLQMWFSEHFFAPKLAGLFVTPIVSSTVEQIWREKMSENHIPFDFWDDWTLANQGSGKTIEKRSKELPWNQQICPDVVAPDASNAADFVPSHLRDIAHKPLYQVISGLGNPHKLCRPFPWFFWACRMVSKFKICC